MSPTMSVEPERKDQLAALASLKIHRAGTREEFGSGPEPELGRERHRRRVPWGWLILPAVLGGGGFFLWRPAKQLYMDKTLPPPEQSLVIRAGGPQVLLTASGYVNAEAVVDVGTTISGRLRKLEVKKGDHVKRGQVLAIVDDEELVAQRMLARANLGDAVRTLDRAAALLKSGAGTPQEVDKSQAAVDVGRANLALVDARLKQTRIVSPIEGKVLDTLADPGEILSMMPTTAAAGGMAIVRLADLSKTVVEVDVNEADIGKLTVGQPADILLDAYPDKRYQGKLLEIAQIADKAKATVQVKVRVASPDDDVRPNMSAKVIFRPQGTNLAETGKLVVSRRALLAPGGSSVFVVKNGRIERRAVETKPAEGDLIEVVSGLAEGDMVLTSQLDRWRDGDKLPETKKK